MRAYAKVFYISLGCFLFTSGGVPGQTNVPAVCKEMKTQREMNECLASAYGDADRDLNALYASVKARLDPVAIGNLQVAQTASEVWCPGRASGRADASTGVVSRWVVAGWGMLRTEHLVNAEAGAVRIVENEREGGLRRGSAEVS
jgi:uncharacterized protein YecT (DUF1311 family)